MELNKDILINYADLKEKVENQAEKVIKEYFKFKNWKFPSDFLLEDVQINKDTVCISYYGFDSYDFDTVPMDYFLTLDNNLLEK